MISEVPDLSPFFDYAYGHEARLATRTAARHCDVVHELVRWYNQVLCPEYVRCMGDAPEFLSSYTFELYVRSRIGSTSSIRHQVVSLNFFGTWLVKQGHLEFNPVEGLVEAKAARRLARTADV